MNTTDHREIDLPWIRMFAKDCYAEFPALAVDAVFVCHGRRRAGA
jgi:hypothetical protein